MKYSGARGGDRSYPKRPEPETTISDIEKFITARKARNPQAWASFEDNYHKFAIGMLPPGTAKNPA